MKLTDSDGLIFNFVFSENSGDFNKRLTTSERMTSLYLYNYPMKKEGVTGFRTQNFLNTISYKNITSRKKKR